MRDNLLDLVSHTFDLGCIDQVKVVGTDKETNISGLAEDRSVVVEGTLSNPVAEFIGTFGMPNLSKLKIQIKDDVVIEKSMTLLVALPPPLRLPQNVIGPGRENFLKCPYYW